MAVLLAGCGSPNTLRLGYEPAPMDVDCPGSVTVVRFQDSREREAVGVKNDGSSIYSAKPVNEWVSRAFYDQFQKLGCTMAYQEEDYRPMTDYVVRGEVLDAWIKEESVTDYTASLSMLVKVEKAGEGVVYEEKLNSSVERTVVPGSGKASEILQESLTDLVRPVVHKVARDQRE
jgi:hypothetical protein